MSHLFYSTDLEKNIRVNMNIIGLDNKPSVKNIHQILSEWIDFRLNSLKRMLKWELDKIQERIHILEAYIIVFKYLDKVIELIRTTENPKKKIMSLCKLSEKQYEAIINMKIRSLAKLQEQNIKQEFKDLQNTENNLIKTLQSSTKLKTYLKNDLKSIKEEFGRLRSTKINDQNIISSNEIKISAVVSDISAILSSNGWIRFHKGHDVNLENVKFKTGDSYYNHLEIKSNDTLVFFDQNGFVYNMSSDNHQVSRGDGDPLSKFFNLPDGTKMIGMLNHARKESVMLCSNKGYGFIVVHDELNVRSKKGKKIMNIGDSQAIHPVVTDVESDSYYLIITSAGYMLIEKIDQIPIMSKGKGIKLINIPKASDETIIYIGILKQGQDLEFNYIGKRSRHMTFDDLGRFIMARTRRGKKIDKKFLLEKVKTTYNIK